MDIEQINLPLVVLLPFVGSVLAAGLARYNRLASAWIAGLTTILSLLFIAPSLFAVFAGEVLIQSWTWLPAIGLDFAFRIDGLGALFSLMILVIGVLVITYARYYLSSKDSMGRFFAYMLLFMGSMLGVVLSENLLKMMIFWELYTISSFLLISY